MLSIPSFIEVQSEFYNDFVVTSREKSKDPVETEAIFYRLVIEQANNQLKELAECKVEYLREIKYRDYLLTDHWQGIRKMMLKHAGYRCQLCNAGNRTLHVHHRTYENRGRETVADLIVLCDQCHSQFHERLELAK